MANKKELSEPSGSSAMEFLMTYGWAILVVLAAIGALTYFDVIKIPGQATQDVSKPKLPVSDADCGKAICAQYNWEYDSWNTYQFGVVNCKAHQIDNISRMYYLKLEGNKKDICNSVV